MPSLLTAILARQSVVTFRSERPPRASIERLLEVATRAPNHYVNEPWRFFILAGGAREQFGALLRDRLAARLTVIDSLDARRQLEAESRKPMRAPVIITVASAATGHPKARREEDSAATAAAITFMLLAAPSLGLAGYWRTGEPARDSFVKEFFGLRQDDEIVGFVYLGYPETIRPVTARSPAAERTTWSGWDPPSASSEGPKC